MVTWGPRIDCQGTQEVITVAPPPFSVVVVYNKEIKGNLQIFNETMAKYLLKEANIQSLS